MKKKIGTPLLTLLLTACVTINIYFPAAAAEEAARVIVRDVLEADTPSESQPEPDTGKNEQSSAEQVPVAVQVVAMVLQYMVPAAEAGQADININTPAISRLRQSMRKRQQMLSGFYRSGAIGFNDSGLVAVRDLKAVPLKDRNRLKKLVADENNDRNALYREIARANGHPEWEADIRKTFSRIWIEEAPRGYWYLKDGAWKKK